MRALSQQGIFKENDFAHPLFKEVTYKTLSQSENKPIEAGDNGFAG